MVFYHTLYLFAKSWSEPRSDQLFYCLQKVHEIKGPFSDFEGRIEVRVENRTNPAHPHNRIWSSAQKAAVISGFWGPYTPVAALAHITNLQKKEGISMKRINIKCPYCGSQALLRPASVVHERTVPGEEVYVCARFPACDAYVSAHRNSHLPMGTLADKSLRQKRRQAHIALNRLWEQGFMTRKEAYRWLQVQLSLPESEAHIGRFSAYRCEQVINLCSRFGGCGQRAA